MRPLVLLGLLVATNAQCPTCAAGCPSSSDTSCNGWSDASNQDPNLAGHCQAGYYGRYCGLNCPTTCAITACTGSGGRCYNYQLYPDPNPATFCQTGYYGQYCGLNCPTDCAQAGCTGATGYCIGYQFSNTTSIASHCKVGFYGQYCANNCPTTCAQPGCTGTSGYCLGYAQATTTAIASHCQTGNYGQYCGNTCPNTCAQQGCTGVSGYCVGYDAATSVAPASHCQTGYYGQYCSNSCPTGCAQPGCTGVNGYCIGSEAATSTDIAGYCKIDYYGSYCSLSCPLECAQRGCTGLNGYCVGYNLAANTNPNAAGHCIPSRYGSSCQNTCPSGCATSCTSDGSCTGYNLAQNLPPNIAGHCKPGRYGRSCSSTCPQACSPCTNTGTCCSDSPTKRPDQVIPGSVDGLDMKIAGLPRGEVLYMKGGIPFGVALYLPVEVTKVFTLEVICRYCDGEVQRQTHRLPVSKTIDVRVPYVGFKGLGKLLVKFIPGLNVISAAVDVALAVADLADQIMNIEATVNYAIESTYCTRGGVQGRRLLQFNITNTTNATVLAPVNDSLVIFARANGTVNITVPGEGSVCGTAVAGITEKRCVCDNDTAVDTCGEIGTVNASFWLTSPGTGWDTAICQPQVCGGEASNPTAGVTVTYILDPTVHYDSFSNSKAMDFLNALLNQGLDPGLFIVSVTTNPLLPGVVAIQVYSPSSADNGTLITFAGPSPLFVATATSTSGFDNAPPAVPLYTRAPTTIAPSLAPTQAPTQAPNTQAPSAAPNTQAPSAAQNTQAPSGKASPSNAPSVKPSDSTVNLGVSLGPTLLMLVPSVILAF